MTDKAWSLRAALGIGGRPELVAFVGGGGKTSLMFALAAELPGRTILTTTTRIFAAQIKHAPAVVYADDLSRLDELLAIHGRCLVVGRVDGDKAHGVEAEWPARLLARPGVDHVLVEADGSRMRPVKAPAAHEPVIPPETTLLVPVAGIDALSGPLDVVAHRPELIRGITNDELRMTNEENLLTKDDRLTPAGLARVLTHPSGGLKGAPAEARVVPFLNKVETERQLAAARKAAALILSEPRAARVVIGALHSEGPVREVWRRVTAVVPAAGESRRMGRNKLSLPWGETTVLGQTIANARSSGISDILVITGHDSERVEALLDGMSVRHTHNPYYAKGMLSSVQVAVRQLPGDSEAALVILGDQPMVDPTIIRLILQTYAAGPKGLIAPAHHGRRGNPVLIDRRYFKELLALAVEEAPRVLLERYPYDLELVEVDSETVLHDLDRPEDYDRWRP